MKVTLPFMFAFFVGLAVFSIAQAPAEPFLIDEHGPLPCDDLLSRWDALYTDLSENPGSTGLISISTSPEKRRDGAFRRMWIERYTRYRRFDLSRINIVRVKGDADMKISYWRVPFGASEPRVDVDESYEIPPSITKPFVFASDELFDMPECSPYSEEIFGRFLKANPSSRANIVVRNKSQRMGQHLANEVVSALISRFGISRNRIRSFVVRSGTGHAMAGELTTELWYLP